MDNLWEFMLGKNIGINVRKNPCNTIFASFIVSDNARKTHKTICVVLFISFECAGVNGFINSALAVRGIHVCNK